MVGKEYLFFWVKKLLDANKGEFLIVFFIYLFWKRLKAGLIKEGSNFSKVVIIRASLSVDTAYDWVVNFIFLELLVLFLDFGFQIKYFLPLFFNKTSLNFNLILIFLLAFNSNFIHLAKAQQVLLCLIYLLRSLYRLIQELIQIVISKIHAIEWNTFRILKGNIIWIL